MAATDSIGIIISCALMALCAFISARQFAGKGFLFKCLSVGYERGA